MAFLAHREEIRAALHEGWPRAAVHARLRSVLGMSYQQFVRYVDRYLADVPHGTAPDGRPPHQSAVGAAPQTGPALSPRLVPPTPPPALPVAAPTAPQPEGGLPRFTYNPGLSPRDKLV